MAEEMNAPPVTPKLSAALVAAQKAARAVVKDSKNTNHNYKYAAAEDIIEEGRAALLGAGLALSTTATMLGAREDNGEYGCIVVRSEYLLEHESGERRHYEFHLTAVPGKGRPWDKAETAAITQSLGYFIRNLLMLPRVQEGDQKHLTDSRDDSRDNGARHATPPPASTSGPRDAMAVECDKWCKAAETAGDEAALNAVHAQAKPALKGTHLERYKRAYSERWRALHPKPAQAAS